MLIAYYFPPENTIGAARPARFAKYLAKRGYPVQVISRALAGVRDDDVLRVPAPTQSSRTLRRMTRVFGHFNRWVMPNNDRLSWLPHCLIVGSALLARRPNDVIISTHPPIVTHLVAMFLKIWHGNHWVADFRDPLLGNPVRSGRRSMMFDAMLERWVFARADAIIANTDAVSRLWRARYPQYDSKIHLIWNGIDRDDGMPSPLPPQTGRTRRMLAHVGTIYGGRTPAPLLDSFNRLRQAGKLTDAAYQLRLIGPIENESLDINSPLCSAMRAHGTLHVIPEMVPQAQAQQETREADCLLLLDIADTSKPSVQLPAKVFEYIRACRPILAFTPPGSVIRSVLARSGVAHACISALDSDAEIDQVVLDFITQPLPATTPSDAFWEEFEASAQTDKLIRIIKSL